MNYFKYLHNSLTHRRLLPPPISLCNNHISSNAFRSANPALLHQAHASCGRAFCVVAALLALTLSSCEKESTSSNDDDLTRNAPADSTANTPTINLKVDTAWADTIDVYFGDDSTTTITIADPDSIDSASADLTASRRQ